jgi:hypothetical protein
MSDIDQLQNMPEAELKQLHKDQMKNRAAHYNVYLDELARRETVRQGERMEALTRSLNHLTKWIVGLTVVITIATIAGVAIAVLGLLSGV